MEQKRMSRSPLELHHIMIFDFRHDLDRRKPISLSSQWKAQKQAASRVVMATT